MILTWQSNAGCMPNAETLWRDTLAKNPNRLDGAHQSEDGLIHQAGKLEEAMAHLEQALRISPTIPSPQQSGGRPGAGWAGCRRPSRTTSRRCGSNPISPKAHYNLGVAWFDAGRLSEAMQEFEQALRINPDFAEAHVQSGVALAQLGGLPEAIEPF